MILFLVQDKVFQIVPSFRPWLGTALETTSAPPSDRSSVKASERLLPLRWVGCKTFNRGGQTDTKNLAPDEMFQRVWLDVDGVRVCPKHLYIPRGRDFPTTLSVEGTSQPHLRLLARNYFIPFLDSRCLCHASLVQPRFPKVSSDLKQKAKPGRMRHLRQKATRRRLGFKPPSSKLKLGTFSSMFRLGLVLTETQSLHVPVAGMSDRCMSCFSTPIPAPHTPPHPTPPPAHTNEL